MKDLTVIDVEDRMHGNYLVLKIKEQGFDAKKVALDTESNIWYYTYFAALSKDTRNRITDTNFLAFLYKAVDDYKFNLQIKAKKLEQVNASFQSPSFQELLEHAGINDNIRVTWDTKDKFLIAHFVQERYGFKINEAGAILVYDIVIIDADIPEYISELWKEIDIINHPTWDGSLRSFIESCKRFVEDEESSSSSS